jgi:hypothetical protein
VSPGLGAEDEGVWPMILDIMFVLTMALAVGVSVWVLWSTWKDLTR